jgi:maltose alpha-D-glucosyltransferase/alpha-amylase
MQRLKKLLTQIYPDKADTYERLWEIIEKYKQLVPSDVKAENSNPLWYKNCNLYVTYGDSFATDTSTKGDLKSLAANIDNIAELGVDALHILPFLDSPMIDAGFDIKDYKKVRSDLGGDKALDILVKKTQKYGIKIFVDLVLNHISNQHKWFRKAVNGDEKYREYFIYSKEKPDLKKVYKDDEAVWAEYDYNGRNVKSRIIFPEQAGEIPHWIKAKDGYWYYHTFYPHQLDVDWNNPEVLLAYADIIAFWASKGFSFRLDAITYAGKDIYAGITESHPNVFKILEIVNKIVHEISPSSAVLVETCQDIDTIKKYFGTPGKQTAQLAYNFPLMSAMWAAIVDQNTEYIWKTLEKSSTDMAEWGSWITFLRNHDELTLEYVDEQVRRSINEKLAPRGLPFREGFGVSGRTASLLENKPEKILMAYFLLASLPGNPAIIYGDEIAKLNDHENMKIQTQVKRKLIDDENIQDDTRDINRGYITQEDCQNPTGVKLFKELSNVFNVRKTISEYLQVPPKRIEDTPGVLAAEYKLEDRILRTYVNLLNKPLDIPLADDPEIVAKANEAEVSENSLHLAPFSGVWLEYRS